MGTKADIRAAFPFHSSWSITFNSFDSWSQTPGPPGFNTDDQVQQEHWQTETGKLWEVTTTRTQSFDFQTIDDILEENARQKREIQQLNNVISNDIAELNQKVNLRSGRDNSLQISTEKRGS